MAGLGLAVAGSLFLWVVSAGLAIGMATVLALLASTSRTALRWLGGAAIGLTRGVPTSLLVVAAGIAAFRLPPTAPVRGAFPGTPDAFQGLGWLIALALGLGSAGHLAVIFRSAAASIGPARLQQSLVLGVSPIRRLEVLGREAAVAGLAPSGARLVHHLHNTAFAALFPVAELFGWLQAQASATFEVNQFMAVCAATYVALSGLIWLGFRSLEHLLAPGGTGRRRTGAPWLIPSP